MTIHLKCAAMAALGLALLTPGAAMAQGRSAQTEQFERVATFLVCQNTSCDRSKVPLTAAEIVAASEDGRYLVYTDSPNQSIGFVDITDASKPLALGTFRPGGEPISVAVVRTWVLVAVNTSQGDFANPSGFLGVFDLKFCALRPTLCEPRVKIPLAGQPDSVAVSPDRRYAAIVIENQRNEDVTVGGVEGGLPQLPGGTLQVLTLSGQPERWPLRTVDLSGLSAYAPGDPEPEYVSINQNNVAAVTLQENNHIVLVDLATAKVVRDFPAGTVDLRDVDVEDDGLINPMGALAGVAREPDAVAWLSDELIATANEGDLFGGSRGFTIFTTRGDPVFDSGVDLEYLAMAHGHYPEGRSDNKGTEPEAVVVARYGQRTLLLVGSERGNFVAVYEPDGAKRPRFVQLLPTGIGPEGVLPIPRRDLLVVAAEDDEALRSMISIFRLQRGAASYPTVVSDLRTAGPLAGQAPIGWVALSALAADRVNPKRLYTAHDAFLAQSRIYVMDVADHPARITDEIVLSKGGAPVNYDIEGLVQRADGSFWVVSEGSGTGTGGTPNLLVHVLADGTVPAGGEIPLPPDVAALKRSNGFEGVAVTGAGPTEQVYVAFQREWTNDPVGRVRIGRYTPATGEWRFFYYPLDEVASPAGGFVGLSEIVALDADTLLVLERDNQGGPDARIKRFYTVSIAGVTPTPQRPGQSQAFPLVSKLLVRDLLPDLAAPRGWIQEKVEGVAVALDGNVYIVTDNDGVDENTGETQFIRLGHRGDLGF
jgi:hypothetical protein